MFKFLRNIIKKNVISDTIFNIECKIDDIITNIKRFKTGIKNIIQYSRLIYNDRDWDYSFFIDFIEFKLKRVKEYFIKYPLAEGDEKIPLQIDEILTHINNYKNYSYSYSFKQEEKEFNNIFNKLKKYMRGWWN